MGFKVRIFVNTNLNFRQISLMKYDKFDLYCSLPQSREVLKHQGLSEENKKKILESKAFRKPS